MSLKLAPDAEIATTNQHEFRFVGLARSGNHAIINWIIAQIPGKYCFLNCAEPKFNPFKTARPLSENGPTYETNLPGFNLASEQKGAHVAKDYLLYSYEDCFLGSLNSKEFKAHYRDWIGTSDLKKDILILRDPFNLFASRIKRGLFRGHYTHHGAKPISTLTVKRIYKQHAKEFFSGKKKFLKHPLPISFNRWSTDKEYRGAIAEELDLNFNDQAAHFVSAVAGGSSFDGTSYSGSAQKMDVNGRWRKFIGDHEFWRLFDRELADLTSEIFGEIPPVAHYRRHYL